MKKFSGIFVLVAVWSLLLASSSNAQTAARPIALEVNFDDIFDWKKPCSITFAEMDAKLAALEKIPGRKIYSPEKSPTPNHLFNPRYITAYDLKYVVFNNRDFVPESARVMWANDRLDTIVIRYTAQEGESQASPALLASITEALGAPTPSKTEKGHSWEGLHYRATASFTVSHSDPIYLVIIRPKATGTGPVADQPSAAPAASSGPPALEINLDQIIDWKYPLDVTKLAFEALIKPYETSSGPKVYSVDVGGATGDAFIISSSLTGNPIPMKMFGGRFQPSALRIEWTNGKATRINVIFPREAEVHTVDPALVAALDQKFGLSHVKTKGIFDDTHSWSFERHRVDYSAHNQQPKFYLSIYSWTGPAATPAPAVVAVPPTSPPSAPAAQQAPGANGGATVGLDPLINWENPLGLKPEDVETLLKPQTDKAGTRPWHDHADGETIFSSNEVGLTLFGGRLKMRLAALRWNEPKIFQFEFSPDTITPEDKEWARTKLDELLKVERRKMISTNSAFTGHEWIKNGFVVRATQVEGRDFVIWIRRPQNFDSSAPTEPLAANLDALLNFATLWNTSSDAFDQLYTAKAAKREDQKKPPQFEWMNAEKTRARFSRQMFSNAETKLTMFANSIKVEEAVVEFVNGKAAKSTISFYNRGDSGDIEVKDFDRIFKTIGQNLGQVLKVAPKRQINSTNAALPVAGWMWTSPQATALLEYNEYQVPGKVIKPEFLRLKLAAPGQTDYTMGKMVTGVQSMELIKRVTKKPDGEVYITGVPMVDQGQKGYCVAASCQRLFEYMRIPCDQHEMAQLVQVDADSGANVFGMQKSLAKIDGRFKVSFKPLVNPELYYSGSSGKRRVSEKEFNSIVKEYVNKGVPLLWALELGKAQEDPPLPGSGQTRGGHMRMIIGYKMENNLITKILFTDSWGAGHELKRMGAYDAYDVTIGLYSMAPRGL